MEKALLIGSRPEMPLGAEYVEKEPYDLVVIGSLSLGQLLKFRDERVLSALAEGKRVVLYTPGLPKSSRNRPLSAALSAAERELRSWGVVFTDVARKHLITAEEAAAMKRSGERPDPGAVLTPLAREILEGST